MSNRTFVGKLFSSVMKQVTLHVLFVNACLRPVRNQPSPSTHGSLDFHC